MTPNGGHSEGDEGGHTHTLRCLPHSWGGSAPPPIPPIPPSPTPYLPFPPPFAPEGGGGEFVRGEGRGGGGSARPPQGAGTRRFRGAPGEGRGRGRRFVTGAPGGAGLKGEP